MIKIIDIDDSGLSTEQLLESVSCPEGAIVRRGGRVVARIEPADDEDLEEELWLRQPEQVERGQQARDEYKRGETIPHEQVCRELGIEPGPECT